MNQKNILAIVPALIPSSNIGIIAPMKKLAMDGKINFKVALSSLFQKSNLDNIDIVIFCRNTELYEMDILNELIKREIPYIYEIDDNFFEIPLNTDLGRYHRQPLRLNALKKFIEHASLVRVYSETLLDDVKRYSENCVHVNTYFDLELFDTLQKDVSSNKIKIIYATSRMADNQQAIFDEALIKIAQEYPKKVEIYFWGAPIANEQLKKLPNTFHLAPIYNYEKFIQKFYSLGFDIGLAPVFGGKFYNSKTNNKYREYGACKIAGVYSDEPLYSCVSSEENGLLVQNDSPSWYEGIKKLIDDDTLRDKIAKNAFVDVEKNYSFTEFCKLWYKQINTITYEKDKEKEFDYISSSKSYDVGLIYAESEQKLYRNFIAKLKETYSTMDVKFTRKKVISIDSDVVYSTYDNIFLFTSNEECIDALLDTQLDEKKRVVIFTTLDKRDVKDNLKIVKVDLEKPLSMYAPLEKNLFSLVDDKLASFGLVGKDKENFVIRNLKKIAFFRFFIEKITYVWSKQNSIRLRLSSYWTIFKINNNL